jgi:hypothetical protein
MLGQERMRSAGSLLEGLLGARWRPEPLGGGHPPRPFGPVRLAKSAVGWLDSSLRARLGIFDFSADPDCILRIELGRAQCTLRLSDGVVVAPGDPVLELHFWNEHMPRMERRGCTVAWARLVSRRMRVSLEELARYAAAHPEVARAKAIRGRLAFSLRQGRRQLNRLGAHYGFDVFDDTRPPTLLSRLHDAGENILLWLILWAYNPASIRYSRFLRPRREMWMSLATLAARYDASRRGSEAPDSGDAPDLLD